MSINVILKNFKISFALTPIDKNEILTFNHPCHNSHIFKVNALKGVVSFRLVRYTPVLTGLKNHMREEF